MTIMCLLWYKSNNKRIPYFFCKNLSSLAFTKAVENINKKLNANLHKKIVYQNIDKLSGKSFGNIKK